MPRKVKPATGEWLPPEERLALEVEGWRRVAAYYLGAGFTDFHTPEECLAEAARRQRETTSRVVKGTA